MNAVFSYNQSTKRYGMQFEGQVYHFTYDFQNASVKTVWNESGVLIAKSYKGFRNKLGIVPGSPKAQKLMDTIKQVKTIAVEA